MDFVLLSWLLAIAVTVHNFEEAVWLPGWAGSAGRWHPKVGAGEFRFAVIILTAGVYVAAYLAAIGDKESVGAYLITGVALVMLVNVLFPHVLATVVLRRYAPGTATALLLNLPIAALLLSQAFQDGYVRLDIFTWAGPLIIVALLASVPVLFAIGRFGVNLLKGHDNGSVSR